MNEPTGYLDIHPNESVTIDTGILRCEVCGERVSPGAFRLELPSHRAWHLNHAPPLPGGMIRFEDLGPDLIEEK